MSNNNEPPNHKGVSSHIGGPPVPVSITATPYNLATSTSLPPPLPLPLPLQYFPPMTTTQQFCYPQHHQQLLPAPHMSYQRNLSLGQQQNSSYMLLSNPQGAYASNEVEVQPPEVQPPEGIGEGISASIDIATSETINLTTDPYPSVSLAPSSNSTTTTATHTQPPYHLGQSFESPEEFISSVECYCAAGGTQIRWRKTSNQRYEQDGVR
jgi:hypothetical protein